jgi:hypothetical protein
MWVGFVVKHVARKAAIGAGVVVAAVLSTGSGRRIARVSAKSAKLRVRPLSKRSKSNVKPRLQQSLSLALDEGDSRTPGSLTDATC